MRDVVHIFAALADSTRLGLLKMLQGGEICVCDLHTQLGTLQPKVSRHLAALRKAGLVATRRDGRWIYYRMADLKSNVANLVQIALACCEADGHRHYESDSRPRKVAKRMLRPAQSIVETIPQFPIEQDPMLFD